MRWVAHGMYLNESLYCVESVKSIYDFVDEIVLVEGANAFAYNANSYGLSSDDSYEKIMAIPDPEKKIKVHRMGWVPTKRELRNASLRALTYKQDTCILVLDLDEIWDPVGLQKADERFNSDKELIFIHNELIQFRGDFKHYRDMSTGEQEHSLYKEQSEKQPITCADGTILRQGRTAERFFKWLPGMHYVSHTCICDATGRYPYIDPAYKNRRIWDPDIKFFHANYLKPFEQLITKFCYFGQQDAGLKRNDRALVERALNEGYIQYLRTGVPQPAAWAVTELQENVPDLLKQHPYYHKSEKEIVDSMGKWFPDPDVDELMALLENASKFTCPESVRGLV